MERARPPGWRGTDTLVYDSIVLPLTGLAEVHVAFKPRGSKAFTHLWMPLNLKRGGHSVGLSLGWMFCWLVPLAFVRPRRQGAWLAAALVVQAAALRAGEATAPQQPGDEEAQVRQVLAAQIDAWNRGDLVAFCAVYADDATFLSPSGVSNGRDLVLERYQKHYPDKAAMGTLALEVLEVRIQPGASTASIAARWSLAYPDKPVASGLTLLVLHRKDATWQIVQDASM